MPTNHPTKVQDDHSLNESHERRRNRLRDHHRWNDIPPSIRINVLARKDSTDISKERHLPSINVLRRGGEEKDLRSMRILARISG